MKSGSRGRAAAIVTAFAVSSYVWIIATARFVEPISKATGLPNGVIEVGKGVAFVTLAAPLLLVALRWYARDLLTGEELWLRLTETTQDGLFVARLGPKPRFEFVNRALEDITGYPAQSFLSDPLLPLRIVRARDRPLLRSIYVAPTDARWPLRVSITRADGELRWLRLSASVVPGSQHSPVLQGLVVDVTDDHEREDSLERAALMEREAAEALRASDRAKQAFLTAISHELRTPLTVMYGMAQTLLRHGDRLSDEERLRAQTSMAEHANRLRRTLDDLMDIDRLERGLLPGEFGPVDIAGVVRDTVAASPARHRARITAPDELVVHADAIQISRMIANLLENAEKYAPDGPIDVTLESGDTVSWKLTVSDHGPGIPEHERERVFEPFHRIDDQHPQPGTGIGLALVSEFAKIHGGFARAVVDDGLTVSVEVPVSHRAEGSRDLQSAQ